MNRLAEEAEAKRQEKLRQQSSAEQPQRRRLLPNETPLQGLKRLNFNLYRDLLAKAGYDESKVMDLLAAQGRQLFA